MLESKNKVMLSITLGVVLFSILIHALGRYSPLFDNMMMHGHIPAKPDEIWLNLIALPPILFLGISAFLFSRSKAHHLLPTFVMLALVFSSISLISGSGGGTEFHFSIFMVVAILCFYESALLMIAATLIFTVQHLIGFFFAPEMVFGVSTYSFTMVATHAFFLVATSLAVIFQIVSTKRARADLNAKKDLERTQTVGDIVQRLTTTSGQLHGQTGELSAQAQSSAGASGMIREQISGIYEGSQEQKSEANTARAAIQKVGVDLQQIVSATSVVAEVSDQSSRHAEQGNHNIVQLMQKLSALEVSVRDSSERMQMLNEHAQEISKVTELIRNIASQTNMLALNASIEASRAGEAGRGFSIVASEIQKLAQQSNSSAESISAFLSRMNEDTQRSSESIQRVTSELSTGMSAATQTEESFRKIWGFATEVDKQIQQILSSGDLALENSNEASSAIATIASITENFVEACEQAKVYAESQLQYSGETAEIATKLGGATAQLRETIARIGA
ncbi:methyl-accepting chemotaxis protein [Saccharibacillus sp. JS10]|uniref:methyl-accepting chemotaxis protein n=1 Tax=Saccharibacillus sp. JS10 TaxID=2950552 RepID=UPI00210C9415|nr:methyl-accepting chemotaxis protein [Saccharibacillus sp. JS10]MCQ4086592.1 methyl-accepting chemotaxis protein [Saccharibacillus sp. JS10]